MPLVQAKCTNCGAALEVDKGSEALICKHCGSAFIVEKAINYYQTYNTTYVNTPGKTIFKPAQSFTDVSSTDVKKNTMGPSVSWKKDTDIVKLNEISHRFDNAVGYYYLRSDGTLGCLWKLKLDYNRMLNCPMFNPIPFTWKNLVDFRIYDDDYSSRLEGITIDGKKHIAWSNKCDEKIETISPVSQESQTRAKEIDLPSYSYKNKEHYVEEFFDFVLCSDGLFDLTTGRANAEKTYSFLTALQQRGDKYIRHFYPNLWLTADGRVDRAHLWDDSIERGIATNVIGVCGDTSFWDGYYFIFRDGTAKSSDGKTTIKLFIGDAGDYKKKISATVPDPMRNALKEKLVQHYKRGIEVSRRRMSERLKEIPALYFSERKKEKSMWEEEERKFQKCLEIAMSL